METRVFHLQNLSALHVGTGQGVGVVDLPIARAKATNLPIVPGSAIKGVLRDALSLNTDEQVILFGPYSDDDEKVSHAGAIAFGDANLLLLPIRSFAGTVAYATCPYILRQYQRDMNVDIGVPEQTDKASITEDSKLMVTDSKIALEDLDIDIEQLAEVKKWAESITKKLYPKTVKNHQSWREQVSQRFVILPDDVFSFLADTATEIRTRIRIDRDTRVVKEGALWTEENLPADSVLWGVLGVSMSRKQGNKKKADEVAALLPTDEELNIQIGGKHTVGRGLCRLLINDPKTAVQGDSQ